MRRRPILLFLALIAALGLAVSVSTTAMAAPEDPPSTTKVIVETICDVGSGGSVGMLVELVSDISSDEACGLVAKAVDKVVNEAWESIKNSLFGDFTVACQDVTRWLLKKAFTFVLFTPSIDLNATTLWDGESSLAGMLMWVGLLVAVGGLMWQVGRMALTGQTKQLGRSMTGWAENVVLSVAGLFLFVLLLRTLDTATAGIVESAIGDANATWEKLDRAMVPDTANPIHAAGIVAILLPVTFLQMVSMFLREAAIPIICLMLPIAGAGRMGGDTSRQWLPKLISSALVIVFYKFLLAIIICAGFTQMGAPGLLEWLRGLATLVLGLIAPIPLMKVFMPFGMAVGGGMAGGGGASGALAGAAGYFAGKGGKQDGPSSPPPPRPDASSSSQPPSPPPPGPPSAVERAQYVEQSMGRQGGNGDEDSGAGSPVPAPRGGGPSSAPAEAEATGAEASGTAGAAAGGPAAIVLAASIQVIDGVNDAIQHASSDASGGQQ
ncbi:hypothetical protein [Streptomyces sp. Isolate_45]|uniref:hypothetical protein n=1 Tax=Streptomyces sp. Isolate_45 TaxID=2950111 RepID=UPI002481BEA5|nr:hypothetical protein [Streptomyces sp. Isolate_45]MDA5279884.1 hypothetical protein [Streptomyces sp. Isolate_45]